MSDGGYINRPQLSKEEMDKKLDELRNSVSEKVNKWADKIQVSMAFTPQVLRQEGEVWTENGKTWTLKNGLKQTISRLVDTRMPWWCPKCANPMNHRHDRKFYYLRGWCYNCNVEIEGQMRIDGTYEKFERQLTRANEVSWIKDTIEGHLTYIKEFKEPTVYFENGGYEVIAKKEVFQERFDTLLKDVEFLLTRLDQIKKEEDQEVADEHTTQHDSDEITTVQTENN